MSKSTETKRPARLPLGLIGMLVLVVLIERHIGSRKDLSTMVALEWRLTAESVKRNAPKTSIPCFGTSLTRMGVSPKILEEKLGKSAYNFSLSGGQPFATYTMLRHVLNAGGKPEALIVDFKWTALMVGPTWNERVLPEMATLRECLELGWAARDSTFFGRMFLITQLQSYRCREEIRANILAGIKGKMPPRNHEHAIESRNALVNKGANHSPKKPDWKGEIDPREGRLFPKDWKCDPLAEVYIHKFLDLASERKIPVFWLVSPIAPATLAERERLGAENKFTDFIKAVIAKHPSVTVVDARFSEYPVDVFMDTTHLNRDGAVTLTSDLADAMVKEFEPTRDKGQHWVSLPKFKPSPDAEKVEDLLQTLIAIGKEKEASRRK